MKVMKKTRHPIDEIGYQLRLEQQYDRERAAYLKDNPGADVGFLDANIAECRAARERTVSSGKK